MSLYGGSKPPPYGKQKFFTIFPSAHMLHSRPPTLLCGRAGNACTNLLGSFVRYVRTRGSMRLRRIQNYRLYCMPFAACTCHAWLVRLTRARGKRYIREGNTLLYDFWYFSSQKSTLSILLRFFAKNPPPTKKHAFPAPWKSAS